MQRRRTRLTKDHLSTTQKTAIVSALNNHRTYDTKKGYDPDQTIVLQDWIDKWNDQNGLCAWTGLPMTIPDKAKPDNSHKLTQASADRVDCNIGHTYENTILTSVTANLGRNNISYEAYWDYMLALTGREPMYDRDPNAFED